MDFLLLLAILVIIILIVLSHNTSRIEGFLGSSVTQTDLQMSTSTVKYNTDFTTSNTISNTTEDGISGFAVLIPNRTFSSGESTWIIELKDIGEFTEGCGSALKLWGNVINPNEVTNLNITFSTKEGFLGATVNTSRQSLTKSMTISIASPYGTYGTADTILIAYSLRKPGYKESFAGVTVNTTSSITYKNGTKFNSPLKGNLNTTYFDPSASWIMTDETPNGYVRFHAVLRLKPSVSLNAGNVIYAIQKIKYNNKNKVPTIRTTQALLLNASSSSIYNVELLPAMFTPISTGSHIQITPKKTITQSNNVVILIAGYYKYN